MLTPFDAEGKVNYGNQGVANTGHLLGELMKIKGDFKMTPVFYRGSAPAMNDLLAGHIPMMFSDAQPVMSNIRSGKLRALAVTSDKRTPFTPELPTLAEEGIKGFAAANWWGWSIRWR